MPCRGRWKFRLRRVFRQQNRAIQLGCLSVEGVEGIGAGALCGRGDHQVGKSGTTLPVHEGGTGHVVARFEGKLPGGDKLFQNPRDSVTGKSVGSLKHPDKFYHHLAVYEAGPFRCKVRQQHSGRCCLPRIVVDTKYRTRTLGSNAIIYRTPLGQ